MRKKLRCLGGDGLAYAWIIWDLLAVGVLVYFVNRCATDGLARTLVRFLGFVIAAVLAGTLSPWLTDILYRYVVRDVLELVLTHQIESVIAEGATAAAGVADLIPRAFLRIMQDSGQELVGHFYDGDAGTLAAVLVDGALKDPVLTIVRGISFFILFSLALFLVRRLSYLFSGINHLPLVGTLNTFLGGVVGVFEGVLVLYLSAVLLQVVMLASGNTITWLNERMLDATLFYRIFFSF